MFVDKKIPRHMTREIFFAAIRIHVNFIEIFCKLERKIGGSVEYFFES